MENCHMVILRLLNPLRIGMNNLWYYIDRNGEEV